MPGLWIVILVHTDQFIIFIVVRVTTYQSIVKNHGLYESTTTIENNEE